METLWIEAFNWDQRVTVMKALAKVRKDHGDLIAGGYAECWNTLEKVTERPQAAIRDEDHAVLEQAGRQLQLAGATVDILPGDEYPGADAEGEDEADDGEDALFVQRTALSLMAMAQGNPSIAVVYAATLRRNTGDEEFYEAVFDALMDAFPEQP